MFCTRKTTASIGFESIQRQSVPPSISCTILSLIALNRDEVSLHLSLCCLREIRLGASYNLANSKDSPSIPIVSEIIFNTIISRLENRRITPLLEILPDSFIKLLSLTCICSEILRILRIGYTYKLKINSLTIL